MNIDRTKADSFEVPGFVSENRPEFEKVRSVSSRSERPLFFARYRHDKPNLGLLEQTPMADQLIVSVELRRFRPINVFCDGRHTRKPATEPGALALYDMRRSWCADIRDPFDTLQVFLPINTFRDFATERNSNFLDFRFDIQETRYDTVMLHLMQAMLPTLERPNEVSALYLDSMFRAVRDHIAEAYGSFTKKAMSNRLGLTPRQLRHALEYIEANLSQDVGLSDVADASTTSVSSLTRGFKTALGVSPHRWMLNRRIALAQRLIYERFTPLNEVAISCGFADQSHLTRVFVRNVGISPAAWRRKAQR
ncbi:MAG TPA: AraC family transcriptional regulator [Acidobacteriaceae bacterium]|nr:AraC family transcriptional regulator [Acidobacteriaceae bacterium]